MSQNNYNTKSRWTKEEKRAKEEGKHGCFIDNKQASSNNIIDPLFEL